MKVFYDSSTPADGVENTELTGIISYPECISILDKVSSCSVVVLDLEGDRYATWKDLNFRKVRVEDNPSNIIWRGYIVKKTFTSKDMTLYCRGIGALLEWRPFTYNYVLAAGVVETVPAGTDLVLKDSNEGAAFGWAVDQWHEGSQNKGLMITDNTNTMESKTWDSSAIAVTGAENQVGNNASTLVPNDDVLKLRDDDALPDTYVDLTVDGVAIADTNSLKSIEITYQFGMRIDLNQFLHKIYGVVRLQIKKGGVWTHVKNFQANPYEGGSTDKTFSTDNLLDEDDPFIIEGTDTELQEYFDKTGANYTSLKGIRFTSVLTSNSHPGSAFFYLNVDYLSVKINYNTADISPIMRQITDNGASWVACAGTADWSLTGVNEDDSFVIGESTEQIINDLSASIGTPIHVQSTLTKYIARWFKGISGLSVLDVICDLEGCHWFEDYVNNRIVISAEADFIDSTVDLSDSHYEWNWNIEDDTNNYYRVDVYGAASFNIHAFAEDITIDSLKTFTIIEEQILTQADAQDVADAKFAELQTKALSIMITMNTFNPLLTIGGTVGLTMARPTIAAADYPIRRTQVGRRGILGEKTILYCGLGSSPIEETIGTIIKDNAYRSQKAHTDRLISSPLNQGAVITWTDVGGRVAGAVAAVNATGLALASTKVITSADEDLTFIFGRAQIDSRFADMMTISHRDMSGQDVYAFGQLNDGKTYINTPTGKLIYFHINDVEKMSMSVNSLNMSVPIAMGANKITGMTDPAANQDAATKKYVDELIGVNNYIHLQDQKPNNTGGGTFTAGAWRTRVLNTEVTDQPAACSLAANQFTLLAGTYIIYATAPGLRVDNHKAKLRNITDGSDEIIGTSEFSNSGVYYANTVSIVSGLFTIASSKVFEIQHRCGTTDGLGFGNAVNFNVIEVYTDVQLWKVG